MLLEFLFQTGGFPANTPATIFLNHGDYKSKRSLQEAILERAADKRVGERPIAEVRIADGRWINLDNGQAISESRSEAGATESLEIERLRREIEELRALVGK